jgi:hypothetical protein
MMEKIAVPVWVIVLLALLLVLSRCGMPEAGAGGNAHAVLISGPGGGVQCYSIVDDTGNAVGGNCIKL